MRLFLAIYPPKEYYDFQRKILRLLDKEKRNIIPTKESQIQLTVKFIGAEVSNSSFELINQELTKRAGSFARPVIEAIDFTLGTPRQNDPRIFFTFIDENPEYKLLTNQIHSIIKDLKLEDTISWKPQDQIGSHVSIARVKPNIAASPARRVRDLLLEQKYDLPGPFEPTEMYLVSSVLTSLGPVYKNMSRIKL